MMMPPDSDSNKATPTEAEYRIAADAVNTALAQLRYERVAQALADQRAKYERGVSEISGLAERIVPCSDFWRGDIDGLNTAVEIMRRAARG